ncbi:MAG: caspase family protein [Bacteroidota bacterium]
MKKALIVGINYYEHHESLEGCVNDAYAMNAVLERHSDNTINFDTRLLTTTRKEGEIVRGSLKHQIKQLFTDESDIALYYFSGHGHIESTGGYLMTSECDDGDEGMSMNELMDMVNESPAKNKIVILDCCHSGILGNPKIAEDKATLSKGTTIITASSAKQYAFEKNGSGVFTNLLVDALNGSAANLTGDITPGSIYAHIDQSLGPWQQRPIFRANIENFISLRKVPSPIEFKNLLRITALFKEKNSEFILDPTYEPTAENASKENTEKFAILQKYNRVNLVVPVGAAHMYDAAMESKSCVLTVLGRYYWKLVKSKRL